MANKKTPNQKVQGASADSADRSSNQSRTYIVTKLAGPKVNGKRVKEGDEIQLTEDQARSEEILGTIKKKTAKTEDK